MFCQLELPYGRQVELIIAHDVYVVVGEDNSFEQYKYSVGSVDVGYR
jgi:hypothetical protein